MKTETKLLVADDWEDYALLDSGHLQKLERFGSQTVIRPDPQAFWEPVRMPVFPAKTMMKMAPEAGRSSPPRRGTPGRCAGTG